MINDPYFNKTKSIERLFNDYLVHGNLIVAFDWDDTIFDYHNKGFKYPAMIAILKQCQDLGFKLILFTGSEGYRLALINIKCHELGLNIKYINESPIMKENRKPYYNILLDDRAGLGEAYYILTETIKLIKKGKKDDSTISV